MAAADEAIDLTFSGMMSLNATQIEEMLNSPAMAPPPGITPNFTNPPNDNKLAWTIITMTLLVATICVIIRAFHKIYLTRKIQIEEALILSAYCMYWGQAYGAWALIYTPGYGVHQWNLHYRDIIRPSYLFLVFGNMYTLIIPALKVAILIEWCRIFVNGNKTKNPFWWGCILTGALQVSWGFACLVLLNFQCIPQRKIWEFYLEGECISLHKIQMTSSSIQVFTDVVMTVLPQKVIWDLQLSTTKKIGVSLIFGLGIFACVAASIRLYSTVQFGNEEDQIFYFADVAYWCIAEGACGFFILCVPCLPKIIKETLCGKRIRKVLGFKKSTYGRGTHDTPGSRNVKVSALGAGTKRLTKGWGTTTNAYYEMDEDEVALKDVRPGTSSRRSGSSQVHRSASLKREDREGIHVTTSTSVVVLSQYPEEA